jgi:very-short-patch-repair endonuclease
VTTVARTLLDLAEVVSRPQLARAFEESDRLGLLDLRQIEDVVEQARGRHGLRPLRALLEQHRPTPAWTRSELERQFARLLAEEGISPPSFNTWVAGFEVDAVWRDRHLAVELDGWEYHRTRGSFELDRRRGLALTRDGYEVLRLSQRQLESTPADVVAALRERLDRA